MTAEEDRTRLIGEIARVLRDGPVPEEARAAALTVSGWLARRMPGEPPSTDGEAEMICRAAALACAQVARPSVHPHRGVTVSISEGGYASKARRNVRGPSHR